MLICEYKSMSHIFFRYNHRNAFVNPLLFVALNYDHKQRKNTRLIANTRDLVSLKLKLAVLGQNLEENSCFRHQNISSPLDGIDGSKAVDKMLLEVSVKIGKANGKKELELFQRHGF